MTDTAFPFHDCPAPDAGKAGMLAIVKPGMDWSEVHCGKCGAQGIVHHAELLPPSPFPAPPEQIAEAPVSEPVPEPDPTPAPAPGRSRAAPAQPAGEAE
ncbi:hypothetical protein [Methylobacterium sp. yr596]|uniref:hypothetical protein n=1 Tax=Methylobacterium sp. yr596 TaxID=1761800 RepID=UPI0008E7E6D2|nr:hypothetical protein [Methylobacterium sp. yr596]SFE90720.1 hypothetical protein SAMN04487844_107149 [Methylobacterium sp. yr596]